MAKRVITIDIDDPAYEGFQFTAWMNYPSSITDDLRSGDEKRVGAAIGQVVQKHNFVDYDGKPYPQPTSEGFLDSIPPDLAGLMMSLIQGNVGRLSKPTGTR
jgi:hypothetical protein